jgi:hypothetical protein
MLRLTARAAAALLTVSWLGGSCQKPLTDEECVRLLEHYVELLLESDRGDVTTPERVRIRAEARIKAANDPEFRTCSERVSRKSYECALGAENPDMLEKCLL